MFEIVIDGNGCNIKKTVVYDPTHPKQIDLFNMFKTVTQTVSDLTYDYVKKCTKIFYESGNDVYEVLVRFVNTNPKAYYFVESGTKNELALTDNVVCCYLDMQEGTK